MLLKDLCQISDITLGLEVLRPWRSNSKFSRTENYFPATLFLSLLILLLLALNWYKWLLNSPYSTETYYDDSSIVWCVIKCINSKWTVEQYAENYRKQLKEDLFYWSRFWKQKVRNFSDGWHTGGNRERSQVFRF